LESVEFDAKRVTRTRVYIPKKMWRFAGWWSLRVISPPVWGLNLLCGTTVHPATLSHFLFQRRPNIREKLNSNDPKKGKKNPLPFGG